MAGFGKADSSRAISRPQPYNQQTSDVLDRLARVVRSLPVPDDRPTSRILVTDFVFNAPVDESVFQPTPPAGCRVLRADMDPDHASEKDILSALKTLADHHHGSFPAQGLGEALQQYGDDMRARLEDRAGNLAKEEVERLDDDLQASGALAFRVMQFNRGQWKYVGGARLGDGARPVFWYKPHDGAKYRVVFGDLTVQDRDTMPKPEANRSPEQTGSTRPNCPPS